MPFLCVSISKCFELYVFLIQAGGAIDRAALPRDDGIPT
jgi:hypothetical protein